MLDHLSSKAKYTYDAWGNHKIHYLDGTNFVAINSNVCYNSSDPVNKQIATLNPFRYRGYYFDSETGLYYLNSRYYDPEIGRFINPDDVSVLEATQNNLNGLNLYVYCLNNPVNDTDVNGDLSWWQWLLFGLGALLVVAATVVLTVTSGGAFVGLAGSMIVGAAKGALIGATIGTVAGGIIGGVTSGWSLEGILAGMAIGFGAGAIVGAVTGGVFGGISFVRAASMWNGGKISMIDHFLRHGLPQMHYKNPIQYTKKALNVIKTGKYVDMKNAYLLLHNASKNSYKFVGLTQNGKLITTYSIRTFSKTTAKLLGLL